MSYTVGLRRRPDITTCKRCKRRFYRKGGAKTKGLVCWVCVQKRAEENKRKFEELMALNP